jgi:hypothetical protein
VPLDLRSPGRHTRGIYDQWCPTLVLLFYGAVAQVDHDAHAEIGDVHNRVAEEHSLIGNLGMSFSNVDRQALTDATMEVVYEWNAVLPDLST